MMKVMRVTIQDWNLNQTLAAAATPASIVTLKR